MTRSCPGTGTCMNAREEAATGLRYQRARCSAAAVLGTGSLPGSFWIPSPTPRRDSRPSFVPSAWTGTRRLCRMDVSLFLQNVATSSVASASVIPLRMLTLAQLAGKRSTTNGTTPFIY
ncbi:hypothetical protein E2I00_009338, partial [Balaenoptera physalus]